MITLIIYGLILFFIILVIGLTATALINEGWLYFSDGTDTMKVYFKSLKYNYKRKPTISHYPAGLSLSYDLGKAYLEINVKDIYLTSYSNYETFVKYINLWQYTSGHFTVQVQYNTSGNYAELKGDGNGTSFTMCMKDGLKEVEKIGWEDCQVWTVGDLRMEEGG